MVKRDEHIVELFSDGACSGNPGVGGYCAILRSQTKEREISGCEGLTTNNRMELLAVISGLEALKRSCRVRVTSDSNYVVKGMTQWIQGWIRNNWKTPAKKDVMNRDLWERLLRAAAPHEIEWVWVRGHNGHAENERCDKIARREIKHCRERLKGESS